MGEPPGGLQPLPLRRADVVQAPGRERPHRGRGDGSTHDEQLLHHRVVLVMGVDDRFEPVVELAPAQERRQPDVAHDDGAGREDPQGVGHDLRGLVQVLAHVAVRPAFAEEHQEELAEHVECGQARHEHARQPQPHVVGGPGLPQDGVLGEEPGQEGGPRNGQDADGEGPKGRRHGRPQAAHRPHVCSPCMAWMMLPEPRNRHALKKAWVSRWKTPAAIGRHAHGQEHVAELADGGVGQHPLDVGLGHGDGGGEEAPWPRPPPR